MRIYLPPALSRLLSAVVLLLSLALVVGLASQAIKLWKNDPDLNQIPKILQNSDQK